MSSRTRSRQVSDLAVQVRPARRDEYDRIVAFAARQAGPESSAASTIMVTLRHDPGFVPDHLRVIEVEGEYAGMLLLIDRVVRFGAATLRCAILLPIGAGGASEPATGAVAMRELPRLAAARGFQLVLRWARTGSGMEQGFGPGQKQYAVVVPPGTRPPVDTGYTVRSATAGDASALAACYHAATSTTLLAEIRSDEPWQWRPADERQQVDVAVDPLGDVRGYARVVRDGEALQVPEIAIVDEGPAAALCDHLLRLAAGREVRVAATPDTRWSRWAFGRGATLVVEPGDGRGAVRVVDLQALLRAARPELERRLLQSEFAEKSARLRLETPPGSVGIVAEDGRLAFDDGRDAPLVTLPWGALSSLVTGYHNAEHLLGQPGVRVEGARTLRLLQVLFPEAHAQWWPPACF